jgi:hypothetical protein
MKKTNIAKVIKNRGQRLAASYIILPSGESYYQYNGEKFTEETFNKMYPVEIEKIKDKGENPCRKYAY